jgi:hypothetical protein
MGTRGYIVVKYNKRYYCRYNHSDSYPEKLGEELVEKIKNDSRLITNNKEQYKENILSVASSNYTEISTDKPQTTHTIEWVYLVDLEDMTLEIIGGYYQPIYKIENILIEDECECHDHNCEEDGCNHICDEDDDCDCFHHLCVEKSWFNDFHKKNQKMRKKCQ